MKRVCSVLILSAMLLSCLPVVAEFRVNGDFKYHDTGGYAYIYGYTGNAETLEIPAELDGYIVKSIGGFENNANLTSVTIPDTATTIDFLAFKSCPSLVSVNLPDTITEIRSSAFENCKSLVSITLPEGLTSIGNDAFSSCPQLTSVAIPDTVTKIGMGAFIGCGSLASVTVPAGVEQIGEDAFRKCPNLVSINVAPENACFSSDEQGILYNKDKTEVIKCPPTLQNVQLPDSLTSIHEAAFEECTDLLEMKIPNSVTVIGQSAFWGCASLQTIEFPSALTDLGSSAFADCPSLTAVILPAGITIISKNAFSGCVGLQTVELSSGPKSIDNDAFRGCSNLTSVAFPETVEHIERGAFYGCTNLTEITLPMGLRDIGTTAFGNCSSLTEVIIPSGVEHINYEAFTNCIALSSVTIMPGVKRIFGSAFSGCVDLTNLEIPNTVELIDSGAFSKCTSLDSISIPASVKTLESDAFLGCTSLVAINILPGNMMYSSDGQGILYTKERDSLLKCPGGKAGTIEIPDTVSFIDESAFSDCTNVTGFAVADDNAVYTADAQGLLYDKAQTVLLHCPRGKSDTVSIPDTVLTINEKAFWGCEKLTSLTFPSSVQVVRKKAFYDCLGLTDITFENPAIKVEQVILTKGSGPDHYTMPVSPFLNCNSLKAVYGSLDSDAERFAEMDGIAFYPVDTQIPPNLPMAIPATVGLLIDSTAYDAKVYYILGYHYITLKDLAVMLRGSEKSFYPGYSWAADPEGTILKSGMDEKVLEWTITAADEEVKDTLASSVILTADDKQIQCTAFEIDGTNYFRLRDLARILNLSVIWDAENNTVQIDSAETYTE